MTLTYLYHLFPNSQKRTRFIKKYLLSVQRIEAIFKIHHKAYVARVLNLKPTNHALVSKFESLRKSFADYVFKGGVYNGKFNLYSHSIL